MAEDLTAYLTNAGIKVRYMHHDIDTIERMEIIRDLRLGTFDVLVGINLLREGLDLPEVSLVAILDADKEGFLRSETSLIQTIGRAARNAEGLVVMYADSITLHAPGHRRDRAPPGQAGRLQPGARHRAQDGHQVRPRRDRPVRRQGRAAPLSEGPLQKEREAAIAKLEKEMREAPSGWNSSTPPSCETASSSCGDMGEGMALPRRKPNRLPNYDYSQAGYYFITLCTKTNSRFSGSRP